MSSVNPITQTSKDNCVETSLQFCTFSIDDRFYGINVMQVQEIIKDYKFTEVPLANNYIHGLLNLRGQIATAISLRNLFNIKSVSPQNQINVVCAHNGTLLSLVVDSIGEVLNISKSCFENTPETIPMNIKKYMTGVYKTPSNILSIIDLDLIIQNLKKEEKVS